jgi:hypothetical protein
MTPLVPVFLALLSLFATPAFAVSLDDADIYDSSNYGARSYGSHATDSSGFDAMQETWAREAVEAERRNEAAVERRNQAPVYEPTPANPHAPFGVWSADGSYQVCQRGGSTIYCF